MEIIILIIICIRFINHQGEEACEYLLSSTMNQPEEGLFFQKVFRVNETVSAFQNNPSGALGQIVVCWVEMQCYWE